MKRILIALFASALLLTGCFADSYGPNAGLPRHRLLNVRDYNDGVTPASLLIAENYWNSAIGHTVFWTETQNTPIDVRFFTIPPGGIVTACGLEISLACTRGWNGNEFHNPPDYPYTLCDIDIRQESLADWTIIAHELGHCLGFKHVDWRVSIMNTYAHDPANPAQDGQMARLAGY